MRYDDDSPPEPPVLKARKGIWELSRSAVEALGFPERVCCYVFPETRDFTAGAVFIAPAPYRGRVGRVLSRPKFTTQVGRMHWIRMGSQGRQIRLVPVRWPGDDVEILVGAWGGGQIHDMLAKRWKVEPSGEPATGGDRVCDAENPPLGPGKGGPLNDTSTLASATTTLDRPSPAAGDGAVHDALGAVPLELPLDLSLICPKCGKPGELAKSRMWAWCRPCFTWWGPPLRPLRVMDGDAADPEDLAPSSLSPSARGPAA